MEDTCIPKLAFSVLDDAEQIYKDTGTFPSNTLEKLHSFFGQNFVQATELLEKCKVIEYKTDCGSRNIFKIINRKEQYTIYNNINFCQCETFRLQVLESRNVITCKHVLAVKLAQITGQLTKDVITGSHFVDFLSEQLNHIEEETENT